MKIYYISTSHISDDTNNYIAQTIESLGQSIKTRDRVSNYESYNFDNAKKAFVNNSKAIRNADIVVAECSYQSSGLGYEISFAIEEKKPVIALYSLTDDIANPAHIKSVPTSLRGNTSRYLLVKQYDLKTIKKTLELAIKDAESMIDTKFILIIPPAIDRYLEWNVREKGVSKAEVTREAIEKMVQEDTRYQEHLKNNELEER